MFNESNSTNTLINKVKKEELRKYFKKITNNFSVANFYKITNDAYFFQVFTDNYEVQPAFIINDFRVTGLNVHGKNNEKAFDEIIREFMIDKFGEEYKKAYKENVCKKATDELSK